MINGEELIKKALTEESVQALVDKAYLNFLKTEKETHPDHANFYNELSKSDFFKSMYNQAFRIGVINGIELLKEALKTEEK
jgi:hypothetical protein